MDWFKEGDIIYFTQGTYRGAIGVIKGICSDYDGIEYFVLIEGDEDNWNNYRVVYDYDIGYVYLAGGTEGSKWIYLLAGIGMPLLLQKGIKKIFKKS